MLTSVFAKSLRDRRQAILVWSVSMVAIVNVLMWFYPSIESTVDLTTYLQALPPALRAAFLSNFTSIGTPEGYLNIELFALFLPAMLCVLTIGLGTTAIAGEEERGTLDLILATPLARRRLVLDKFAAIVVELAVIGVIAWLGLVLAARWVGMRLAPLALAEAMAASALFALFMGALALALGGLGAGKGMSSGIASIVGVAAYLLHAAGTVVEAVRPWQKLSPYYWYLGNDPLLNGIDARYALLLLGGTLLWVAVAVWGLQRRDIAL